MILLIVLFVLIWFLLFVFKPGSKPKMGPNLGPFLFSFVQASSSQARAQQLQGRTHQETKKLGPKQSQPHRAQRPANEAAAAFPFLPRPELHGPTADPFHPRVCSKVPSANSPLQLPSLPHQARTGLTPCPIAFCPNVRHQLPGLQQPRLPACISGQLP